MIIAFGTILKIQSYHARNALVKLIIMAVLINFSKTITGVLIDFAQVVMMTFVDAFKNSAPIVMTVSFNIQKMQSYADSVDVGNINLMATVASMILAVILLIVAITVVLAMGVVLLARILMLWILVILSPIAYIATVLPNTQRYATAWWSSLGKNLISGPLLAFFLWLSLSIISTSGAQPISLTSPSAGASFGEADIMTTQNMFNFIITIALLIMGLMMTQSLGVMGGSFAGSMVGQLRKAGISALKTPLKVGAWGTRKIKAGALPGRFLKGVDFNPASIVRTMRAGFAKKKQDEENRGMIAAGERLQKGGFKGAIGGLGAASWVENYAQGFLYRKGIQKSAPFIARGRQSKIDKLAKDRDKQVEGVKEAEAKVEEKNAADIYRDLQGQRAAEAKTELTAIETEMEAISAKAQAPAEEAKEMRVEADRKEKSAQEKFGKGEISGVVLEKEKKEAEELRKQADEKKKDKSYTQSKEYADDQARLKELETKKITAQKNANNIEQGLKKFDVQDFATQDKHAREFLLKLSGNKDVEARRLAKGGMTKEQRESKELKVKELDLEVKNLNLDISKMKRLGQDSSEAEKRRKILVHEKTQAEDQLRRDVADPDDIKKNQEQAKKLQEESLNLSQDAEREYISQEQRVERKKQAEEKQKKLTRILDKLGKEMSFKPIDFLAQQERRRREHEESRKYDTTNEDELIAYFRNALQRENGTDAAAVALQSANVGHLNELINTTKATQNWYEDPDTKEITIEAKPGARIVFKKGEELSSGIEGMHVFMKEVFDKKLNYGKQASFALENDLSNIAEDKVHWTFGQAVGWKDGNFYQRSRPEQQTRCYIERSKRDFEQLYRGGNRLSIGTESWKDPDDHSKGRKAILNEYAVMELTKKWEGLIGLINRGRFNASASEHIMQYNQPIINLIQKDVMRKDDKDTTDNWNKVKKGLEILGGQAGKERKYREEVLEAHELLKKLGLTK